MITKRTFIKSITALFLLFSFNLALAAIPSTLNYQGHLTGSNGAPIDGPVNIVFAIYDVDSGGTALWSDSLSVTVNQGVFSVELGDVFPFPPGLFESPLWMGLTVDTDTEMFPRRSLSSVGFSFKARDANTLEGISASTLDQSSHVTDTANPHNVSAIQIGAADSSTLTSHISNSANPHSVSAAQTGAATSANFTAHTVDINAHHSRYTNIEAVAAMGKKSDANTLNHDKYSNANAVAAILAADGAGSTLDADMVDGLQASEIIDAAQDEVRTPISSLPYNISNSGSYYITANLTTTTAGITISTEDVTLDFMGFTIDGGGSISARGITITGSGNITIQNGIVKGFGYGGIYKSSSTDSNFTVTNMKLLNNGSLGTSDSYSGIYITSHSNIIDRCISSGNGVNGIYVGGNSSITNSVAHNNGADGFYASDGSSVSGSTSYMNGAIGFVLGRSSNLINSTARDNADHGIYGSYGVNVRGNTVYNNTKFGINLYFGGNAHDNTAYANGQWGIYAAGTNSIKDNTIYNNNATGTLNMGGLRVGSDSRVTGNTIDNSSQSNLYVAGSDNAIENNLLTDSTNGIYFSSSGNFYGNNRASGNTSNFNLNGTTQTTSSYLPNISF